MKHMCMALNKFILNQIILYNSDSAEPKKQNDFFIAGTNRRKKMSKVFNKYITTLDYDGKMLLLSSASSGTSLC